MASFSTAADLQQRYAVSAQVLLAYARRGNLAMRRPPTLLAEPSADEILFDEEGVARLFPRRASRGSGGNTQPTLGVLGASRMGHALTPDET